LTVEKHKIFWVGVLPPENPSIGDHAQTLAAEKLFKRQFSDYELKRYSDQEEDVEKFFAEDVQPDDLVFIQSGGHFGNLNIPWHNVRKKIISRFPKNKIIQLPVSICYHGSEGAILFEADKIFFSDKKNVLILCRTEEETKILRTNFGCRVKYFPDLAFSLKPKMPSCIRQNPAIVLRDDDESSFKHIFGNFSMKLPLKRLAALTKKDLPFIARRLARKLDLTLIKLRFASRVTVKDFQVANQPITDENREKIVYSTIANYRKFKYVITDRFHGVVFSMLAETPIKRLECKTPHKHNVKKPPENIFRLFRKTIFDAFDEEIHTKIEQASDISQLIKSRRSVRKWICKPVESDKIQKILEAGVYAPSAANLQATRFKILNDPEYIHFVCQHTSPWFRRSFPNRVILVLYDKSKLYSKTERFVWQDTACAMQNMMLAAESLSLKTCWASVNPKQEKNIKKFFGIPKRFVLACMLFLGYSDVQVSLKSRHQGRQIARNVGAVMT
jgi:exopolysaccharide biosynthesis predicted pyruvyltransferase EpsI/nitroreductase